ncbi:MAG TPA: phosphoethanolamine--lipid A transferase [Burkholderiales bacterium]
MRFAAHLRRPELAVETILFAGSLLLASLANLVFWRAALAGRPAADPATLRYVAATFVLLAAAHFFVLGLVATRHTVRPLLALAIVASAALGYYMQRYGVVFDASMVRNVLRTDYREARDLLTLDLAGWLLAGALVAAALWLVRPRRRPLGHALALRAAALIAALAVGAAALLANFQDLASQMRNDRKLRFAIAPANFAWSLGVVLAGDLREAAGPREPLEPVSRAANAAGRRPLLLVLVIGETTRAANFSLGGYARETNPELAKLDLVYFPHARACGTSTEVSVPCMLSPFGRADYDESRIRRHESLPQLLARAGLRTLWLDNQSGCKGACEGLEFRDLRAATVPGICAGGYCHDEVLLEELKRVAQDAAGDTVVLLHTMGNHGPAYFRRYPSELKRFTPACERLELRDCSREEIVNAYDNAILATDRFLARTVRYLASLDGRFETALFYASDHGESLGEHGLYLHGLPYALAPREQIEVPMFWWLPPAAAKRLGVDLACLKRRAGAPASHDNLYHSVLGLLRVTTARYRPDRDLFLLCSSAR